MWFGFCKFCIFSFLSTLYSTGFCKFSKIFFLFFFVFFFPKFKIFKPNCLESAFRLHFRFFNRDFRIQHKILGMQDKNSVFLLIFFIKSALKVRLKCVLSDLDIIFEFSIKFWIYGELGIF